MYRRAYYLLQEPRHRADAHTTAVAPAPSPIYLSICLSMYLPMYPSIHPSIHSRKCKCIYIYAYILPAEEAKG